MIAKWTLRKNLIVFNACLLIVGTLLSSAILLRYSMKLTMNNLLKSSYEALAYISQNIEDFMSAEVEISTEIMQNDLQFKTMLNQRDSAYSNPREQLVDIYMLRRYLMQKNAYLGISASLSGLINQYGIQYNMQFPTERGSGMDRYMDKGENRGQASEYQYQLFPLQQNPLAPKMGKLRDDLVIPIRKNLLFDGGGRRGAVLYMVKERALYERYQDSVLLKDGYIYMMDNEGRLISHTYESELQKPPEYVGEIVDRRQDYFVDRDKIIISRKLNNERWHIVAVLPRAGMLEGLYKAYGPLVLVILAILLVSVCLSVCMAKAVIRPVEKMIQSMERVEKGDFSERVREEGVSDIVRLMRYYNKMLTNTEAYIQREYRIKKLKRTAELDVLVAQINPHFLYNTLDSIVWQARMLGASQIEDMACSLGRLFSLSVNHGESILRVADELEHAKLYVHLQNIRYKNQIKLMIDLDDEELLEFKTLKLILQPMIENSILHGFADSHEHCVLRIGIYESGGSLYMVLEDNGMGMSAEELNFLQAGLAAGEVLDYDEQKARHGRRHGRGIGLINVHQRIQLYYGREYGLELHSREGEGTEVVIKIPAVKS